MDSKKEINKEQKKGYQNIGKPPIGFCSSLVRVAAPVLPAGTNQRRVMAHSTTSDFRSANLGNTINYKS